MTRKEQKSVARINSTYMKQYDAHVKRQHKKRKRLYRRLVLFAILAMIVFGSLISYHVNQQIVYAEKKEQYEEMKEEMTSLKKEEKDLKQEVQLLQDEEYVKEIARTNYFFSKKGEIIFKLPEEDPSY
ncbi:FtsB family cell division protein [Radiobacillus deserti]|nr:septum formation initiator family protein [Radiobacillus deserti]